MKYTGLKTMIIQRQILNIQNLLSTIMQAICGAERPTCTGNGTSGRTVTVDITGEFYGYNQYWGTAETQILNYVIQNQSTAGDYTDKWGGTANVTCPQQQAKTYDMLKMSPRP